MNRKKQKNCKETLLYKLVRSIYHLFLLLYSSSIKLLQGQPLGNLPLSNASVEFADIILALKMLRQLNQNTDPAMKWWTLG